MKASVMVLFVLIAVSASLTCVEGAPWDFLRIFYRPDTPRSFERNRVVFRKPSTKSDSAAGNVSDREKTKSIEEKAVRPTPQWLKDFETRFLNHEQFKDTE